MFLLIDNTILLGNYELQRKVNHLSILTTGNVLYLLNARLIQLIPVHVLRGLAFYFSQKMQNPVFLKLQAINLSKFMEQKSSLCASKSKRQNWHHSQSRLQDKLAEIVKLDQFNTINKLLSYSKRKLRINKHHKITTLPQTSYFPSIGGSSFPLHQIHAFSLCLYNNLNQAQNSIEMADQSLQAKKYCRYTKQMRLNLIKYVDQDKLSTAHAARLLEIKQTSACRIMKSFHKYNRIFEKKVDRSNPKQVCTEKQLQKGCFLQNMASPQKKLQPQKIVGPNTPGIHQSQAQAKMDGNCQQNLEEGRGANFMGKEVSLLFYPIFGYNSEYYQFYCASLYPLGFGFYI